MRKGLLKRTSILLLIVTLAWQIIPTVALAQATSDKASACTAAESEAHRDISGSTWFIIGCLGGALGYIVAIATDVNPPSAPLVGKDPDYVASYTDCYRREGKHIKSSKALTGCLIGTAASVVVYAVAIAAASNNSTIYSPATVAP